MRSPRLTSHKGKGRPSVSDFDWLTGQLRKIVDLGDKASRFDPEIHHDYKIHTALKLAALNHALDVFTPIARRQADRHREYHRSVYVDLFAGCGVTKTAKGDWLAGSPIIAVNSKAHFDSMVLVERGSERIEALKKRIGGVSGKGQPVPTYIVGDCNALKRHVIDLLQPNDLVFVTADPEGMQLHWETLVDIVRTCPASDLFINCTVGVNRVVGAAESNEAAGKTLERFTGRSLAELLGGVGEGNEFLDMYEKGMTEALGKPLGTTTLVSTESGQPRYNVLIRTRRTSRGSPYLPGYEALSKRLSSLTAAEASRAIDIIKGRQKALASD